jgi:hypothetical protein
MGVRLAFGVENSRRQATFAALTKCHSRLEANGRDLMVDVNQIPQPGRLLATLVNPGGYWRAAEPPLRYGLCVGETRSPAVVYFSDIIYLLSLVNLNFDKNGF